MHNLNRTETKTNDKSTDGTKGVKLQNEIRD